MSSCSFPVFGFLIADRYTVGPAEQLVPFEEALQGFEHYEKRVSFAVTTSTTSSIYYFRLVKKIISVSSSYTYSLSRLLPALSFGLVIKVKKVLWQSDSELIERETTICLGLFMCALLTCDERLRQGQHRSYTHGAAAIRYYPPDMTGAR